MSKVIKVSEGCEYSIGVCSEMDDEWCLRIMGESGLGRKIPYVFMLVLSGDGFVGREETVVSWKFGKNVV